MQIYITFTFNIWSDFCTNHFDGLYCRLLHVHGNIIYDTGLKLWIRVRTFLKFISRLKIEVEYKIYLYIYIFYLYMILVWNFVRFLFIFYFFFINFNIIETINNNKKKKQQSPSHAACKTMGRLWW